MYTNEIKTKSFWQWKGMEYIKRDLDWYTSDDPLSIEYREYYKAQQKIIHEEMNTKGICSSCIFLYDESTLTACIKNDRWFNVSYDMTCDINSWEGFNHASE